MDNTLGKRNYDIDRWENEPIEFVFNDDGSIRCVLLKEDGTQICGSPRVRDYFEYQYNYCANTLKSDLIVEMGVGTGKSLKYLLNHEHKIIEINKQLFEHFKDECNITQGDFFEHINTVRYTNTSFIIRSGHFYRNKRKPEEMTQLINAFEYQTGRNNYLCLENPAVLYKIPNCEHIYRMVDGRAAMYFIRL